VEVENWLEEWKRFHRRSRLSMHGVNNPMLPAKGQKSNSRGGIQRRAGGVGSTPQVRVAFRDRATKRVGRSRRQGG